MIGTYFWQDKLRPSEMVGLDNQATKHPEWFCIGASRARVTLYALFLENTQYQ